MKELVAKLRVRDEDFLVASTIERCPKTMMLRELVQNALEAATLAPIGTRRIEITARAVEGARKLRIWNTGPGMNAEELFRMCDISSSIGKVQQLDGNFGMGAKVASLPSNHLGLRYRSCHQGKVSEVIIGKRDGVFGRILREDPATGAPATVLDVTAQAKAEGDETSFDWTEVILLGNRAEQDTVVDPYDGNPRVSKMWVLQGLHQRFFRVPDDVQFLLGTDLHGLPGMRPLVTIGRLVGERFERWETVSAGDGVAVHFGYDPVNPKSPQHNASYVDRLTPDGCFAGILFGNELYEMRTAAKWTQDAPSFGISLGARHLSFLVELAPDFPVRPEGYRQFLRYKNGLQDQVRLMDFAGIVRDSRPDWLLELIRRLSPDLRLIGSVQEQLENLIAALDLKRMRPVPRGPQTAPLPNVPVDAKDAKQASAPATPPRAKDAPAPPPKSPTAEAGNNQEADFVEDREVVPEMLLLRDEREIADRNLTHRAARFYPATHQLYVNMTYPSVTGLAELLRGSAPAQVSPVVAREAAQTAAENMFVLRLGRALVYGLSKRNAAQGWSESERQQVLSSEVFTLLADDLHLSLSDAKEMFSKRVVEAVKAALDRPQVESETV
ncbi:ATP-binding protein [Roseixanthobacter glucoisosaccharinicivorans]|uniref:ATP-binding protein n=1 Tax=Roseixanthobacter glucoisosaccharinicivorans TaxID=3119923 RepID=UPI00372CA20C